MQSIFLELIFKPIIILTILGLNLKLDVYKDDKLSSYNEVISIAMNNLFLLLKNICRRPKLFEHYTAGMLWDDFYISEQLLGLHLDPSVELVSRGKVFIDRSAAWIGSRFNINAESFIADFGCGPGLYATRFARQGARVTGIDISNRSIEYARQIAQKEALSIQYFCEDYFKFETSIKYDLIVMIFCEFCSLSPAQCRQVLNKFHALLKDGGAVLLDVFSLNMFNLRKECSVFENIDKGGFWAAEEYFGFLNTFKYPSEKVVLDKYTLIEKKGVRTFYNWLQYYDRQYLTDLFEENGFTIECCYGDLAGRPYSDDTLEIAVAARKK